MEDFPNEKHPLRRLHFRIGDILQHVTNSFLVVQIVGYGQCEEVWHNLYMNKKCPDECPNAGYIIEVKNVNNPYSRCGYQNTGYWCCQLEDQNSTPWLHQKPKKDRQEKPQERS